MQSTRIRSSGMPELVEFELEDGSSILIETEDTRSRPTMRGGSASEAVVKADETFADALRRIGPTSSAIVERFRDLPQRPDEIEVEFGIKVSAEAGAIIARASGEANFRVVLRWKGP